MVILKHFASGVIADGIRVSRLLRMPSTLFAQVAFLSHAGRSALPSRFAATPLTTPQQAATWVAIMGHVAIWFAAGMWLGKTGVFLAHTAVVPLIPFAIVLPIAAALDHSRRLAAISGPSSMPFPVLARRRAGLPRAGRACSWRCGCRPHAGRVRAFPPEPAMSSSGSRRRSLPGSTRRARRQRAAATVVWNVFEIADLVDRGQHRLPDLTVALSDAGVRPAQRADRAGSLRDGAGVLRAAVHHPARAVAVEAAARASPQPAFA